MIIGPFTADFLVRIELHGAEPGDYDSLHEEMDQRGFKRVIEGESKTAYQLPRGEYIERRTINNINEIAATTESVYNDAYSAISDLEYMKDRTFKLDFGIIASYIPRSMFGGLKQVKALKSSPR